MYEKRINGALIGVLRRKVRESATIVVALSEYHPSYGIAPAWYVCAKIPWEKRQELWELSKKHPMCDGKILFWETLEHAIKSIIKESNGIISITREGIKAIEKGRINYPKISEMMKVSELGEWSIITAEHNPTFIISPKF